MPPRLSVITPSFNQASYLRATLESVQHCDGTPIEHIVIDGGSGDGTVALLRDWTPPEHVRFDWVSEPDGGQADAVNKGLARATAPYAGWVNSDDLLAPGAIGAALAHFERHPTDVLAYGDGVWLDDSAGLRSPYPTRHDGARGADPARFAEGCFICQPTAFFDRQAVLAAGGLDRELASAMDLELWLRLYREHPGRIGHIDRVLAATRVHASAKTFAAREAVFAESLDVLHRYHGEIAGHWLITYVNEAMAGQVLAPGGAPWGERIAAFLERWQPSVRPADRDWIARYFAADARLQVLPPDVLIECDRKLRTPPSFLVTLARTTGEPAQLTLRVRRKRPWRGRFRVVVRSAGMPAGDLLTRELRGRGPFDLSIPVPESPPGVATQLRIDIEPGMVPRYAAPWRKDWRHQGVVIARAALGPDPDRTALWPAGS
mgnify:CR=1 FL=1